MLTDFDLAAYLWNSQMVKLDLYKFKVRVIKSLADIKMCVNKKLCCSANFQSMDKNLTEPPSATTNAPGTKYLLQIKLKFYPAI